MSQDSVAPWIKPVDHMTIGQSGTRVQVLSLNPGPRVVRKSCTDGSDRLREQYLKHETALSGAMAPLRVPRLVSAYEGDAYDMEYLHGLPLGIFLETASSEEVLLVAELVGSYLVHAVSGSDNCAVLPGESSQGAEALQVKLDALREDFRQRGFPVNPFIHLTHLVNRQIGQPVVDTGWNHGDFSFENILVLEGGTDVGVVDFLNSPFDTPLIDVGRFMLDAAYGWWGAGFLPSANWALNAQTLQRHICDAIFGMGLQPTLVRAFTGLAVLRIVPYTSQPTRMAFLKNAAYRLLEEG